MFSNINPRKMFNDIIVINYNNNVALSRSCQVVSASVQITMLLCVSGVLTLEQSDSWIFLLISHATDEQLLSGAFGSNFGCGSDAIIYKLHSGNRRGWRLLRYGTRHINGKGRRRRARRCRYDRGGGGDYGDGGR